MTMPDCTLHTGDCLSVMRTLPGASIDSVVTDPPYELGFMGKRWDSTGIAFNPDVWAECLRLLKPGGHLVAFGGTRTFHRLVCAVEDAGFDIRDMLVYCYSSGFPKSHNISKGIDRKLGAVREVLGTYRAAVQTNNCGTSFNSSASDENGATYATITRPATEQAMQWDGWGTALSPSVEPICLARKPLTGTVVDSVLEHGTGGINIDGCRIEYQRGVRWPSNLLLEDGDVVKTMDAQSGGMAQCFPVFTLSPEDAVRVCYCSKPNGTERDAGLETVTDKVAAGGLEGRHDGSLGSITLRHNHHPTVKPITLMRWLCRLITPPDGVVLDPFMGSGSTGCAALVEGFRFVGIDMNPEYVAIADARMRHWSGESLSSTVQGQPSLFDS